MADFFTMYGGYLLKIMAAVICGGAIGLERELSGKAAGVRTNILICMGSVIYMSVSELMPRIYGLPADPGRIAAQVVAGIGFIGAGSIIQSGTSVAGLTTAAVIWVVAALGLLIGIGYEGIAICFTVIVLLVLVGIARLEKYLNFGKHSGNSGKDNGD